MKPLKIIQLLIFFSVSLISTNKILAQDWSPNYSVGSIDGKYDFTSTQVPSQLIELNPPAITNTGFVYQWEMSSSPTSGFTSATNGTQSSYTFSAPLTQTTYFRRRTMNPSNWAEVTSNVVKISVVSTDWEDINYIREYSVLVSGITTWQAVDQLPIGQKLQTTTYLDGLGRSVEKVSKQTATPSNPNNLWGDVVQFSTYDEYGTESTQYLPYTTTTQSGKYKTVPLSEQPQYYSALYSETNAYNTIDFETNPLNRIKNVKEAGSAWASSAGKSVAYDANDATDNVRIFSVDYVQGNAPVVGGYYSDNTLYKLTASDEKGNKVIQFINKSGQLILKKVELETTHADPYDNWICTYYVYDDFGLLRFEIQPEAVKYLNANAWSFAGTNGQQVLTEYCFQYNYDDKGRTIWKKTPGAAPLNMVYDIRDRLVFAQDGNQAALSTPQWTATLFDELDRPVLTTLYNTTKTIAQLKTDLDNSVVQSTVTVPTPNQTVTDLVVDSRNTSIPRYAAQNSIEFSSNGSGGFESADGDEFVAEIDAGAASSYSVTTTTFNNPISSVDLNNPSVCIVLKYLFYDNYSFPSVKPFDNNFDNTTAYSNTDPNVMPIVTSKRTLGFPTGSMTRVLETNTFLNATSYYDEEGQPIQSIEDNLKSGKDVSTIQYHFDGRVLSTHTKHTTANSGYTNYSILTKYLFDKLGRVTSIQKKFGDNAFKTISSYDYDDVGRVKTKHLDPGYTANGGTELESLNYTFNIHNQLTGINKDYAQKNPGNYDKWAHFFGMYLGYQENTFAHPQLNGQISGVIWNTQGDDAQRKYDYTYDNAGRLINADFTEQQHPTDGWTNNKTDFSVSGYTGKITYDLNGNLLSMLQKGVMPGTAAPIIIDDLRYSYTSATLNCTNKVQSVTDMMAMPNSNGLSGDFKDGTNGSSPDYVYDNNGNVVIDLNKNAKDLNNVAGANGIHYNFLDKPDQIRIAGKGTIKIVYSADGEKLQRLFTPETGTGTTTTYINQFIYQASGNNPDVLSFINFEEGRIRVVTPTAQNNGYDMLTVDGNMDLPNGKKGVYDYFILDYQQNVRMVLSEETHVASNTATMETSRASTEDAIFGQPGAANEVEATRYAVSSTGWQNSNIGSSVSRLGNTAGHNVGPNTLQKVMAGDVVNANVQYYYDQPASGNNPGFVNNVVTSLIQSLSGGSAGSPLVKGGTTGINSQLNTPGSAFSTAVQPSTNTGQTPLAYLTVLFFDERFNLVSVDDGGVWQQQVSPVGSGGASLYNQVPIKAPRNGYVYVYVSNQSDQPVYFDNLKVSIAQGNIIEENHYYAFGLKIAAISSKKFTDSYDGETKNNYQMQGAFSEMDDDIGWNDFALRNYDPQTGRFVQQDPYEQFASPYLGMGNDPVNLIDPSGGVGIPCPGTSALSIFLDNAVYAIGNTLNSVSHVANIVGWASAGTATASTGARAIKMSSVTNGQIMTMEVGNASTQQQNQKDPTGLLIAESRNNELISHPEDGTHGREGDLKGWKYITEEELKKKMEDLIIYTTSSNKQMREVALDMMHRFFNNTGGEFSDSRLNKVVHDDENAQGFASNVFARVNEELKKTRGDISKLDVIKVGNPAFNRDANTYDGLGITIHGVSYVQVHLIKYEFNPRNGNYHIELQFDLFDNFGLDSEDIKGSWNPFDYHNDGRLKAWWLLQHKFNHVPLRTHVTYSFGAYMNINNTYGIK